MSKPAAARDGQPQHQTKIMVVGAEGREAADAVGRYRAQLEHFQSAEQQRLLLSPEGVDIHRGYATFEGASAVYTNSYGQETIVLHVKPETHEEEEPKTSPDYWDFALVEIELPDIGDSTKAEFSAFVDDKVWAHEDWAENSKDKTLRFGDVGDTQVGATIHTTTQVASLLVDLRGHREGIKIDLRGYTFPYDHFGLTDSTRYSITGSAFAGHRHRGPHSSPYPVALADVSGSIDGAVWANNGDGDADFELKRAALISSFSEIADFGVSGDYAWTNGGSWTLFTNWDDFAHPGEWHADDVGGVLAMTPANADPNTYMAEFSGGYAETFTYWAGPHGETYVKTRTVSGVRWTNPDHVGDYQYSTSAPTVRGELTVNLADYIDYYPPWISVYEDWPATVKITFFKGNPFDAYSYNQTASRSFYKWENSKTYPHRSKATTLKETGKVLGQDQVAMPLAADHAQQFGHPMIGTLKINPRVDTGGAVFTPV